MREGHHQIEYRPMPPQSRFGLLSPVLHQETCYTPEELQFRQRVLTARATSGLDIDLLQSNILWFSNGNDIALINVNENSWFFGNEYRPREELSLDDFHIDLVDSNRLNWPGLSVLMRNIGDYLLIRNSLLPQEHLNQPLNFVLLDVVQILKRLAVIENPTHVAEQLQFLRNYLRAIEIHVSPTIGSDRLFLADCRGNIEHNIEAEIHQKLENQLLKDRIQQLQQQLNKVAVIRHTILHFSLASQTVNPHPYWEHFNQKILKHPKDEFPTLAAKACAKFASDSLTKLEEDGVDSLATLELDEEALSNCPDVKFINSLQSTTKIAYGKSISDLQEILRFQSILHKLLQLFDQGGEVFTLIQFREQMMNLLQNIEQFVQHSQKSIVEVLEANTQAYHQHILDKQDLRWWEKVLTHKQNEIDQFIANQDNLARFSATTADLQIASKELLEQVKFVINHLTQHDSETKQVALITATKELAQELIDSMHAWVDHQQVRRGLPRTSKIKRIPIESILAPKSTPDAQPEIEKVIDVVAHKPGANKTKFAAMPTLSQSPSLQFWSSTIPLESTAGCRMNEQGACANQTPFLASRPMPVEEGPTTANAPTPDTNPAFALSLFIMLPLGILALKLLYDKWNEPSPIVTISDRRDYKKIKILVEDALALALNQLEDFDYPNAQQLRNEVEDYQEDFKQLESRAKRGVYDSTAMQNLLEDLVFLSNEITEIKEQPLLTLIPD